MASCSSSGFLFLLYLIIMNLLIETTIGTLLVDDVCRRCRLPQVCSQVLGNDPRSKDALFLGQLANIAIDKARSEAQSAEQKIHGVLLRTNSTLEKDICNYCLFRYEEFETDIRIAMRQLRGGAYGALIQRAGYLAVDVQRCEVAFGNASPIKSESQALLSLSDAIAVLATDLTQ